MDSFLFGWVMGLLLGLPFGWLLRGRDQFSKRPRIYEVKLSQYETARIHRLGDLSEPQFRTFCKRIINGEPMRLLPFITPPTKIMTRTQFKKVRDELVDRRMAIRNRNNTITLLPPSYAFFRWGAGGRHKQASDNQFSTNMQKHNRSLK